MDTRTYLIEVIGRAIAGKTKIEKWISSNTEEGDGGSLEVQVEGKPFVLALQAVPPKLSSFGVELDSEVRFYEPSMKDSKRKTWKRAKVRGSNIDGSIELAQLHSGAYRSIMPEHIERKEKGKRGAEKWVSLTA